MGMIETQVKVNEYKHKHNLDYLKYNALKDYDNDQHMENAIKIFNEGGGDERMADIYKKRFGKSTIGIKSQIIVTEDEQKLLNDIKIKAINKNTGEVSLELGIGKDKEPVYDIDFIDGRMYYLKGTQSLLCYHIQ
jgi:hypothetical protein